MYAGVIRFRPCGLGFVVGVQYSLALFCSDAIRNVSGAVLMTNLTVPITKKSLASLLEYAQTDSDPVAGADQARTSGMSLIDRCYVLPVLDGAGEPFESNEKRASHFFAAPTRPASQLWPSPV